MHDAVEFAGPLTPAARNLFVRLEPSIESFAPEHKLRDYELVQDGTVVLSIGDDHDLHVDVPTRVVSPHGIRRGGAGPSAPPGYGGHASSMGSNCAASGGSRRSRHSADDAFQEQSDRAR
jgi:hypothetical protein